jgi:hypothetical protein
VLFCFFAAFALLAVLFVFFVCAALAFCSACCFFAFFCCLWKFGNKRGFERGSQEIKVKSSGNQHSCKRIFCSAFAALLAVRLLFCLLFLLPVLFVLCLKNSCGNQQINVEFKMKSRGIKEEIKWKSMWNFKVEIKKNRNTKWIFK